MKIQNIAHIASVILDAKQKKIENAERYDTLIKDSNEELTETINQMSVEEFLAFKDLISNGDLSNEIKNIRKVVSLKVLGAKAKEVAVDKFYKGY